DILLSCACASCRSLDLRDGEAVIAHISEYFRSEDAIMLRNQLLKDDVGESSDSVSLVGWWAKQGLVTFAGAYLPHWVLHPVRCETVVLLQIEEWYARGHIPAGLQALWINAVLPVYVQDYSVHSRVFERDMVTTLDTLVMDADNVVPVVGDALWRRLYDVRDGNVPVVLALIADTGGSYSTEVVSGGTVPTASSSDWRTHITYTTDVEMLDTLVECTEASLDKVAFLPKTSRRAPTASWTRALRDLGHGPDVSRDQVDMSVFLSDDLSYVTAMLRLKGFKLVFVSIRNVLDYARPFLHRRCMMYVWPGLYSSGWADVRRGSSCKLPLRAEKCAKSDGYPWAHYHLQVNPHVFRRSLCRPLSGVLLALFPASSEADSTHTRVYLDEVFQIMLVGGESRARNHSKLNEALTKLPVGTTTVWATGQLLWHALSPTAYKVWDDVARYNLCGMSDLPLAKILKKLENMYRRTARWLTALPMSTLDLGHAVGMSLMTGRARHVSDWPKERANRCDPSNILRYVHPASGDHGDGLRVLADKLLELQMYVVEAYKIERKEWDSYVSSAQNWLSAGSVGGAKIEYPTEAEHPLPPGTLNKRSFLEHVPSTVMKNLLSTTPEMVATASEKYENGKERAIYGTAMVDYLAFGYVLSAIDTNMRNMPWCEMGALGYERIRGMLKRFYILRRPGVESAAGDYADFNRQHMLKALSLRYATLREACRRKSVNNPEYEEVLKWCEQALLNCYAYFPSGENSCKTYRTIFEGTSPSGAPYVVKLPTSTGAVRVVQGLFSGHRGTSNDNTTLNIAYVDIASDHVEQTYGVKPDRIHRVHEGDDIYLAVHNRLFAALLYIIIINHKKLVK
ncbi:MAG: hypothetical protein AAFO91_01860, partial [Bacteroidota bacterium]